MEPEYEKGDVLNVHSYSIPSPLNSSASVIRVPQPTSSDSKIIASGIGVTETSKLVVSLQDVGKPSIETIPYTS